MAKLTYLGINNSSKKVVSAYIGGDDGLSKKIVKAYIGDDNGISRLVYSAEVIEPIILESPSLANSYNGDTFNWPAVANAIGYEVYRYSTLVATVTEPSYYTVQDGEYQVIAKGDGVYYLDSGPSYPFTIDSVWVDSFSIDNISSTTSDVTFSWGGSGNVDYYSIYYSGDGTYYHFYTNTSDTSVTFSISAPSVDTPSASVDYYAQGADIYWDDVEGASSYFVTDPNYKNIYQGTDTSCSLSSSDSEGTYRVHAIGETVSSTYKFNIDAHGPGNSTYYYCFSDYYYPEDEVEMSATDTSTDTVYIEKAPAPKFDEYYSLDGIMDWVLYVTVPYGNCDEVVANISIETDDMGFYTGTISSSSSPDSVNFETSPPTTIGISWSTSGYDSTGGYCCLDNSGSLTMPVDYD